MKERLLLSLLTLLIASCLLLSGLAMLVVALAVG